MTGSVNTIIALLLFCSCHDNCTKHLQHLTAGPAAARTEKLKPLPHPEPGPKAASHRFHYRPCATPCPAWRRRSAACTTLLPAPRTPPPCSPKPRTARPARRSRSAPAPAGRGLPAATQTGADCTTAPSWQLNSRAASANKQAAPDHVSALTPPRVRLLKEAVRVELRAQHWVQIPRVLLLNFHFTASGRTGTWKLECVLLDHVLVCAWINFMVSLLFSRSVAFEFLKDGAAKPEVGICLQTD